MGPLTLRGRIDAVFATADGGLEVVDRKNGPAPAGGGPPPAARPRPPPPRHRRRRVRGGRLEGRPAAVGCRALLGRRPARRLPAGLVAADRRTTGAGPPRRPPRRRPGAPAAPR